MELGEEGDRFEYISLGGCRIAPPCEARASNRLLAARIQDTRIRGLVGISSHSPILHSLRFSPLLRFVLLLLLLLLSSSSSPQFLSQNRDIERKGEGVRKLTPVKDGRNRYN